MTDRKIMRLGDVTSDGMEVVASGGGGLTEVKAEGKPKPEMKPKPEPVVTPPWRGVGAFDSDSASRRKAPSAEQGI